MNPARLLLFFLALLALPVLTAEAAEAVKIVADDSTSGDRFGASMATRDSLLAVGAPGVAASQGAVYLFERDADCTLRQVARLTAGDGNAGHAFGSALALAKDLLLVGAPGASGEMQATGAVYVFERDGDTWRQVDKLFAASYAWPGMEFGFSIATDGRTIMAGAPEASGEFGPMGSYTAGAVYVFEKEKGGWQQVDELRSENSSFMERFGESVAVHDRIALIGGPGYQDGDGTFYVFNRDRDDDDDEEWNRQWQQEERMNVARGGPYAREGQAIVNSNDFFAVGAPAAETSGTYRSGVVFTFERDGDELDDMDRLVADDWSTSAAFGETLAIADDRLLVGAPGANAAYLFDERGGDWQETQRFTAPPGSEGFASSVALMDDLVVVGAPAGNAVYAFVN